MKKYILGVFLILLTIIMAILAVNINAENTGGTAEQREDEKTLVRMVAGLSMGSSSDSKVNIDTLGENLDMYAGSGVTTLEETSSDIITVTFVATGNQYEINVNTATIIEELPSTTENLPYIPTGFTEVAAATATTGLTIEDSSGNEYVWVEVPRTGTVYPTAGLNITEFTSDEYTAIENDLHTYTSTYRDGTTFSDVHSGDDTTTGLTSTAYTALKQKMLKSVYQNGGFYVGKYEAGIADSYRDYGEEYTTEHPIAETVVSQANAYPYNWVRCSQAQTLASGMESGEYTSSLMFGVQWDLVMKYLETKGVATQAELTSDSTSWGNYDNSEYSITNTSAKYSTVDLDTYLCNEYLSAPYSKAASEVTLLTTGASSAFSKMGIYDLAGNMFEWTLEYTSNSSFPCAVRGGGCDSDGYVCPASDRNIFFATYSYPDFRVQALNLLGCSRKTILA